MPRNKEFKTNVYCCVPQCNQYYDKNISFHYFPRRNKMYYTEWVRALKIGKPVTKSMRVCSRHFTDEDFFFKSHVNQIPRLKKNAIPTKNLPQRSHETKRNEELSKQRNIRLKHRHEMLNELRKSNSADNEVPEQLLTLCEGNVEDETKEAAETLLLLLNTKPESEACSKKLEDKCVQVNTYEENNLCDITDLISNDKKLRVLTGVHNHNLLAVMGSILVDIEGKQKKMSGEKRILLTMMKVKLGLTFAALSVFFNVTSQTARNYFHSTIQELGAHMDVFIRFPSKEEILKNMPSCFKPFRQTRVVLDCTEIPIEKSKVLKYRIQSYSHYKGCHTVKYLIGVAPSGVITYLSKSYGGRASDKAIFNREDIISLLEYPDAVMVDKGFLIDRECEDNGIELIRPPFLKKKKQFSKVEANRTSQIAKARVHVERAIQRIKKFRVLTTTIPLSLLPYLQNIMIVIVALTNLSEPILSNDKFVS